MQKHTDLENCVKTEVGSTQTDVVGWKNQFVATEHSEYDENNNNNVNRNSVKNFHLNHKLSCDIEQRIDFVEPTENALNNHIQIIDKKLSRTFANLDHIETNEMEHSLQRQEETLDMYKLEEREDEIEPISKPRTHTHVSPVNENLLNCLQFKNELGSEDFNEIDHITNHSTKESERAKTELSSSESNQSGNCNVKVHRSSSLMKYEKVASAETKNSDENEQETIKSINNNNNREDDLQYQQVYIQNEKEGDHTTVINYNEFYDLLKEEVENECKEFTWNQEKGNSDGNVANNNEILEEGNEVTSDSKDRVSQKDMIVPNLPKERSIVEGMVNTEYAHNELEKEIKNHEPETLLDTPASNQMKSEFVGMALSEELSVQKNSNSIHKDHIPPSCGRNLNEQEIHNDKMKKTSKRKRKVYTNIKNRKNKNVEKRISILSKNDLNFLRGMNDTNHVNYINKLNCISDIKEVYDVNEIKPFETTAMNKNSSFNMDMFNLLVDNEHPNDQIIDWFNAIYTVCVRLDDLCIKLCEDFPHSMNMWEQNGCMVLQMKSFFYNDALKEKGKMTQEEGNLKVSNQNTTQSKCETEEPKQKFENVEPYSYLQNLEFQHLVSNNNLKKMYKTNCVDNYPYGIMNDQKNYYEPMEPYNANPMMNDAINFNGNHFANYNINHHMNQMANYHMHDPLNEMELCENIKLNPSEIYGTNMPRMEMIDEYGQNKIQTYEMNMEGEYPMDRNHMMYQNREIPINNAQGMNNTIKDNNYDFAAAHTSSTNNNNEYLMGKGILNFTGNEECENFNRNNSTNMIMQNYANGIPVPLPVPGHLLSTVKQNSNCMKNSRNGSTSTTEKQHLKQESITNEDKKLIKKKKKNGTCKDNNKILKTEKDYEYLLLLPEKDGPSVDNPEDLKCDVAGVYWDKRSWIASWYDNGKRYYKSFSAKTHGFYKSKFWSIKVRLSKVKGQTIFGKNDTMKRNNTMSQSSNSSCNNSVCMERTTVENGIHRNNGSIIKNGTYLNRMNISGKNENYTMMDQMVRFNHTENGNESYVV